MCHKLIDRSSDLKRLRDEGFEVETRGAHLLVHHVPYVTGTRQIKYGTLVSTLRLSAEKTDTPDTHVAFFIGEHPCNSDGSIIEGIRHGSGNQVLDAAQNVVVNHSFSNKPANGFKDYYEKVTSYVRVISSQAQAIDPSVRADTFKVIESIDSESPFKYLDTNSSRAKIIPITAKLENLKVAIVGLGGTGSYVLDLVAKTPVAEIHLFEGDLFLQHNAFRAPGAPSLEELSSHPKKAAYFHQIYSKMRHGIIPHDSHIGAHNIKDLADLSFVFICIDRGASRKLIIESLLAANIPFIDTGIGINAIDGALTGSVRVTTCTPTMCRHVGTRIPFDDNGNDDYAANIQIAELNALNAILAVIKWKKMVGYYHDLAHEHQIVYEINVNGLQNDESGT